MIPIWWLLFHRLSSDKSYFSTGRAVPLPYARTILPATILLYTLPTVVQFVPGIDKIMLQNIMAYWQLAPVFVNIPLWLVSPFVSSSSSSVSRAKNADIPHLKVLYGVLFVGSVLTHWFTIYGILELSDSSATFASVWVPSTYKWKNSMSDGLLFIFQWDWIIVGIAHVIPAFVAICDVQRMTFGAVTLEQYAEAGIISLALGWTAGPAASLAGVWYWRETKLAAVEECSGAVAAKKGL